MILNVHFVNASGGPVAVVGLPLLKHTSSTAKDNRLTSTSKYWTDYLPICGCKESKSVDIFYMQHWLYIYEYWVKLPATHSSIFGFFQLKFATKIKSLKCLQFHTQICHTDLNGSRDEMVQAGLAHSFANL